MTHDTYNVQFIKLILIETDKNCHTQPQYGLSTSPKIMSTGTSKLLKGAAMQ